MLSTINIGKITVGLEGGDNVQQAMLLPGMNVFVTEYNMPQLKVYLDASIQKKECRWLHKFEVSDSRTECHFGVDNDGYYHYNFGIHGHITCNLSDLTFQLSTFHEPSILRFALWIVYAMGGLTLGRVPVHSSVVVAKSQEGECAVMCLGESGTGKSTHTRLWLENIGGTHLLNDDSPILCVESGKTMVYGSPWSGKTHCYLNENHPVAALIRIAQQPENHIDCLPVLQAFAALQPSCPPCFMKDDYLQDKLVDFVGNVLICTPVFRLGCRPDAEAALLSHRTILG